MSTTLFRRPRAGFLLAVTLALGPVAATAQPVQWAAPPAGVCLLSRDAVIANSAAGKAAAQRLQTLAAGIRTELDPERQAIVRENDALKAAKGLPPAQLQQRTTALQQRAEAYGQLEQTRSQQLQRTRQGAEQKIAQAMAGVIAPIATAHKCAVLFERGGTYGFNTAMDLSAEVMQSLDRALPTVDVQLAPPEAPAKAS